MNPTQIQDPNVPQGLDPTAFYLTKAIKKTETGDSQDAYTAPGKSGEYGAYQYTPNTWNTDVEKYLGKNIPLNEATPEQQNQVAYSKISDLLKDHSQSQVASIWNSGYSDPSIVGTGTNKYGAQYDVPGYVAKVKKNYLSYSQGNQDQTPAGQTNSQGFVTSADIPSDSSTTTAPSTSSSPGGFQGFIQDAASPITKGISSLAGIGAGLIGDTKDQQNITNNGINYGYFGTQKPVGAGFDVSKGVTANAAPLEDAIGTGVKGGLEATTIDGIGSAASGLIGGESALASPIVDYNIPMTRTAFEGLSNTSKLDTLTEALKGASPSDRLVIQKAIQEVTPAALKELGLASFSQKYPALAKGAGLLWKGLKLGATGLIGADVLSHGENFVKGLL